MNRTRAPPRAHARGSVRFPQEQTLSPFKLTKYSMHQVEDVSFGFEFELPVPEPVGPEDHSAIAEPSASALAPVAPTQSRPPPNTSVKRTRSERNAARARISPSQTTRATRTPLGNTQEPARVRISDASVHSNQNDKAPSSSLLRKLPRRSSGVKRVSILEPDEDGGMIVSPADAPKPTSAPSSSPLSSSMRPRTARRSPLARSPLATEVSAEEVTESPKNAPGSGRRRTVDVTNALRSSVLLQHVAGDIDDHTEHPPSSSPLQRIAASRNGVLETSPGSNQRRSVRLSAGSSMGSLRGHGEEDELTPDGPRKRSIDFKKARFKPNGEKKASVEAAPERDVVPTETASKEQVAEESRDEKVAQRLATRKRPRRSLQPVLPELSTAPPQAENAGSTAKRRRKKDVVASPAQHQHPKPKPAKDKPAKKQASGKKVARFSTANTQEDDGTDGPAVTVTVQRFTRRAVVPNDNPDVDILGAEIPFANRSGVNAVDVLSTLCEELIDTFLIKLADNVRNAEDATARHDQRIMLRSLEAFQEELRTRLLEHVGLLGAILELRSSICD